MKMPVPLEKEVLSQCLQWLQLRGVVAWRQNQGAVKMPADEGRKNRFVRFSACEGISDIIGVYQGVFIAVETKRKGRKPEPHQFNFLERINDAGGFGVWVDSVDSLIIKFNERFGV